MREQLICHAGLPNSTSARTTRKAFDITCRAMVATPLLDFSTRFMPFHHQYQKGALLAAPSLWTQSQALAHLLHLPGSCCIKF